MHSHGNIAHIEEAFLTGQGCCSLYCEPIICEDGTTNQPWWILKRKATNQAAGVADDSANLERLHYRAPKRLT